MCTVCGCGEGETTIEGHEHSHEHGHKHKHHYSHAHTHAEEQGLRGGQIDAHDYGQGPAHAHAPGLSQARMIQIEEDILGKNNEYAAANRRWLGEKGVLALNLVSSPGSGKTTLLARTVADLQEKMELAVIEGDQQTANDAKRIRAAGAKALQINTGKGCHLDAHMVGHGLDSLQPEAESVLFIENVGNLVCPAAFDLGEAHKVAILSVTEGEDKPIKYPDMFHAADLILLNKIDLLPYVQFDVAQCVEYAQRVHPGVKMLQVSATSGEGMENWYRWVEAARELALVGR